MRRLQLEYGAEIGRAIVNFDGPIAFCVISRFHGGAFVVFSRALNDQLETIAIEGAFASVLGGAPAAAVVFARDVDSRTREDERIRALDEQLATAEDGDRQRLRAERDELWTSVRSEKLGQVAAEFDAVHSVQRAVEVGSVDRVIPASALRADLIDTIERGMGALDQAGSARRNTATVSSNAWSVTSGS
jgi:acetyl-CoA carboxylase carboxyltransferase component